MCVRVESESKDALQGAAKKLGQDSWPVLLISPSLKRNRRYLASNCRGREKGRVKREELRGKRDEGRGKRCLPRELS